MFVHILMALLAAPPQVGRDGAVLRPGCEPGSGEINYPWLFGHIDRIGYSGWIGCEYKPATTTEAGLGWTKGHLSSA